MPELILQVMTTPAYLGETAQSLVSASELVSDKIVDGLPYDTVVMPIWRLWGNA